VSDKRKLVMDLEVYENYFLCMFKSVDTKKVVSFEMYPDASDPCAMTSEFIPGPALDRAKILAILRAFQIITFNGIDFDMPILFLALKGATCSELKAAANHVIDGRLRHWQFEQHYGVKAPSWLDHIDLMEAVPGVQIGLKLYGGRLHSKRLQELPYPPEMLVGPAERANLVTYCENDCDTTIDLWNKATDPKDNIIETRELLTAEFGIDVRSKSDAQVAEAIIKHRVEKLKGERIYKAEVRPGTRYRYRPPAWLKFSSPLLQAKFAEICEAEFVVQHDGSIGMPPALEGAKLTIGRSTYKMGIGGLHSTEKRQGVVAGNGVVLRDIDVVSYYPALILQCGLFPENMGEHFQRVYHDFFKRRVAAKKAGHKSTALTLKIFLNGTFGKLGSRYSVLYAPNLLIQVTVTGQLALLMQIERMEAAGIPAVSANTDGVVYACPEHLEPTLRAIVKQWEAETGFEAEETKYRALFSRDVNNYLALKAEGGVKTKGVLADPGVMKNPENVIVNQAVCDYLDKGVPIAETVLRCRDVRKFLRVRRVNGGAHIGGEYLGKVCRWYRSRESRLCIEYVKNGNKVPLSDNAAPLMELPDEFPADVDHAYYIAEAHDMLREIGALQ
jgi:hypothetical protein